MVRPERFELPTYCSGGNRSIHLSYGRARANYTDLHYLAASLRCFRRTQFIVPRIVPTQPGERREDGVL